MVIVNIIADFELPFAFSLKDRRKIINSIKSRLKKFNVSMLDISGEYPKEASIAYNVPRKKDQINMLRYI